MNLETLKNEFFIGDEEKVNELCASLKSDCIQSTDKTVTINGTAERLLYNSEDDSYISQHMDIYKECPYCHKLEKVDDFVTVDLEFHQWFRPEGKRDTATTITLCRRCLESETVVVPEYKWGKYLILNNRDTVPFIYPADDNHPNDLRIGFCSNSERLTGGYNPYLNSEFFTDVQIYDYEKDRYVSYKHDVDWNDLTYYDYYNFETGELVPCKQAHSLVLWHKSLVAKVFMPYDNLELTLPKVEIESHPETWVRCSQCGKYYHHSLIENGKCFDCRSVKIHKSGYNDAAK